MICIGQLVVNVAQGCCKAITDLLSIRACSLLVFSLLQK
jgi:hypothetical protein